PAGDDARRLGRATPRPRCHRAAVADAAGPDPRRHDPGVFRASRSERDRHAPRALLPRLYSAAEPTGWAAIAIQLVGFVAPGADAAGDPVQLCGAGQYGDRHG